MIFVYTRQYIILHTTGYCIFVLIIDMDDCEKVCLDHRDQALPIIAPRSFFFWTRRD